MAVFFLARTRLYIKYSFIISQAKRDGVTFGFVLSRLVTRHPSAAVAASHRDAPPSPEASPHIYLLSRSEVLIVVFRAVVEGRETLRWKHFSRQLSARCMETREVGKEGLGLQDSFVGSGEIDYGRGLWQLCEAPQNLHELFPHGFACLSDFSKLI